MIIDKSKVSEINISQQEHHDHAFKITSDLLSKKG